MRRIGTVMVTSLLLTGCWAVPGAGPQRSGHNAFESELTPSTVGSLVPGWTWQADWTTPRAVHDPIASPEGVHFTVGHELVTVDAGTGTERWRAEIYDPGLPIAGSLRTGAASYDAGWVFAPLTWGTGGYTYVYDARTGSADDTLASGALDVAVPRNDRLVGTSWRAIGSSGLAVSGYFVHDLRDPSASWSANQALGDTGLAVPSSPAVSRDTFFLADRNTVYAYPLTEPTGCYNPYPPTVPFRVCPPTWSRAFGDGLTRPTLTRDDDTVIVGDAAHVTALRASTGTERWSGSLPTASAPSASPSVDDEHVFVPSADELVVFDRNGCGPAVCAPVWTAPTGGTVEGQPAVAGGVVYTATVGGLLRAFSASGCGRTTCTPIWEHDLGVQVTGAPAVSVGRLLVGTSDGRLVSFAPASDR